MDEKYGLHQIPYDVWSLLMRYLDITSRMQLLEACQWNVRLKKCVVDHIVQYQVFNTPSKQRYPQHKSLSLLNHFWSSWYNYFINWIMDKRVDTTCYVTNNLMLWNYRYLESLTITPQAMAHHMCDISLYHTCNFPNLHTLNVDVDMQNPDLYDIRVAKIMPRLSTLTCRFQKLIPFLLTPGSDDYILRLNQPLFYPSQLPLSVTNIRCINIVFDYSLTQPALLSSFLVSSIPTQWGIGDSNTCARLQSIHVTHFKSIQPYITAFVYLKHLRVDLVDHLADITYDALPSLCTLHLGILSQATHELDHYDQFPSQLERLTLTFYSDYWTNLDLSHCHVPCLDIVWQSIKTPTHQSSMFSPFTHTVSFDLIQPMKIDIEHMRGVLQRCTHVRTLILKHPFMDADGRLWSDNMYPQQLETLEQSLDFVSVQLPLIFNILGGSNLFYNHTMWFPASLKHLNTSLSKAASLRLLFLQLPPTLETLTFSSIIHDEHTLRGIESLLNLGSNDRIWQTIQTFANRGCSPSEDSLRIYIVCYGRTYPWQQFKQIYLPHVRLPL